MDLERSPCGPDADKSDYQAQPVVTFLLVTYNQAEYVEEALRGALSQTYNRLEILISDDCSTDDTFAIVTRFSEKYRGPHRLTVRSNKTNQGFIRHLCTAMRQVRGKLVVVAAGDDVSVPERVEKVVNIWMANGRQSGSIFSLYKTIDEHGTVVSTPTPASLTRYRLEDLPPSILNEISVGTLGCAHAWTRDVFDVFGDIDARAIHEDITIPLRSLLIGSLTYLPDELVLYRVRPGSLSRHVFSDHRERMRKMAKYWTGRVANYEQFRADARKAVQLGYVDRAALEWALQVLREKEDVARRTVEFFEAPPLRRFGLALSCWRHVPWRQAFKWLVIAVAPWSYGIRTP